MPLKSKQNAEVHPAEKPQSQDCSDELQADSDLVEA
jgi:hypothetical protein